MPAISTLRVDRSRKNKTRKRFRPLAVHTSTLKKSAAAISPHVASETLSKSFFGCAEELVRYRVGAECPRWCYALSYTPDSLLLPEFDEIPRFGLFPPFGR